MKRILKYVALVAILTVAMFMMTGCNVEATGSEVDMANTIAVAGNATVGRFVVDGKVSSLNSFLSPDSEYYEQDYGAEGVSYGDGNDWLADVDGSYGENDNGIFFFTPDGNYFEWTGEYLYSDIPFEISNPIVNYEVK